jgi:acyl dehydratase
MCCAADFRGEPVMIAAGPLISDRRAALRQSRLRRCSLAVSGDDNPIHVDAEFLGAHALRPHRFSHGMLLYTVLWGLVQKHYPGARQVNQTLMFPNPTYAGDPHRFTLNEIAATDGRIVLSTQVMRVADGALTLDGQTEIAL